MTESARDIEFFRALIERTEDREGLQAVCNLASVQLIAEELRDSSPDFDWRAPLDCPENAAGATLLRAILDCLAEKGITPEATQRRTFSEMLRLGYHIGRPPGVQSL